MLSITSHQTDANLKHNEIPLHTGENGHHKHSNKQQVLERMWRQGNPSALLVGLQTGAATVEDSMEFLLKTKNGTAFWSSNSTSGIYPKKPEMLIQKNINIPMFIAALFTIAKIWKQPKSPAVDEWIKKPWFYNGILFSHKKKEILLFP